MLLFFSEYCAKTSKKKKTTELKTKINLLHCNHITRKVFIGL